MRHSRQEPEQTASNHSDASLPVDSRAKLPKTTPGRRLLFLLLTVLLVAGILELGSTILLMARVGRTSLRRDQEHIATGQTWEKIGQVEVLHPYLGYVHDPDLLPGVNQYGFSEMDEELPRRAPDRLVVGVTGGSVAMLFCQDESESFRAELEERFPDREIVLACLAVSGYEQPQQVMAFNYFRCLGAEFDVIVNLDGFNEVVMEPTRDAHGLTFDAFPKDWGDRVLTLTSESDTERAILKLENIRVYHRRRQWASALTNAPWRYSQTGQLIWWIGDQNLLERAHSLQTQRRLLPADQTYVYSGPPNVWLDSDQRLAELVALWGRCSEWLDQVCATSDTLYVHALQPNQYVPDSKEMSEQEYTDAFTPDSEYADLVPRAYPLLRQRGAELRRNGVHFADLSYVFANTREQTYSDSCCHLTELGNALVARELAKEIEMAIQQRRQATNTGSSPDAAP